MQKDITVGIFIISVNSNDKNYKFNYKDIPPYDRNKENVKKYLLNRFDQEKKNWNKIINKNKNKNIYFHFIECNNLNKNTKKTKLLDEEIVDEEIIDNLNKK